MTQSINVTHTFTKGKKSIIINESYDFKFGVYSVTERVAKKEPKITNYNDIQACGEAMQSLKKQYESNGFAYRRMI